MRQFDEIMRIHECNDPSYYNDDENYDLATAEAIGMKSQAVNKLAVYFRYLCGGNAQIIEDISLLALKYFSRDSGEIDLIVQSGVTDFPWKDIVNRNPVVTFNYFWKMPTENFQKLSKALIADVDLSIELSHIKFSDVECNQSITFTPHLLFDKGEVLLGALCGLCDQNHFKILCLFLSLIGKVGP